MEIRVVSWTKATITILLAVTTAVRVSSQDEVGAVIGSDAELACYVDISGSVTVSWVHPDGTQLTENTEVLVSDDRLSVTTPYSGEWILHIQNVKDKDGGVYKCVALTNPPHEQLVTLVIQHPPQIDGHTSDQSATFGEDINLLCQASGLPDPTISWYRMTGSGDKTDLGVDGDVYTIWNASMEDAGRYICEAVNGINPPASAQINVDILFPPSIQVPYQHVSQQAGKDTLLQCLITANPHTTIYWEKDGKQLINSDKYMVEILDVGEFTKALGARVLNLESSDFGEYTCVASNKYGEDKATLHLYEWHTGALRVVSTPDDTTAELGQDARFNCTVEGITPTDNVVWWHQHPQLGWTQIFASNPPELSRSSQGLGTDVSSYEVIGHYDLVVRNVSFTEGGQYICEVTGHNNYSAYLTVTDFPQCSMNGSVNGSSVAEVGQMTMLTCAVQFSGPSLLWEVTWIHGERKLSSINEDRDGQMLRTVQFRAALEDSGLYVCTVSEAESRYHGQCQAELLVQKSQATASPVCNDSETAGTLSASTYMVILIVCIISLLVIFCAVIIAICGFYKKRLNTHKHEKSRSARYKNGTVSLETEGLTTRNKDEDV